MSLRFYLLNEALFYEQSLGAGLNNGLVIPTSLINTVLR